MENIIKVKDLTYEKIFDKLELEIKKNVFTTILDINNSNTSILLKIILGYIKTDASITIDTKDIKDVDKNIIGYIPSNIKDSIIMDTVIDEIMLNNNKVDNKELDKLLEEFGLLDKKLENPKNLSGGEQQLMYIASCLIKHPKIIICDNAFTMLDNLVKDRILKKLKKLSKEQNISVINITDDTEDILYGDNLVIISNNKIILNDKKDIIYNNEQLFRKLHIKMPFMVELSLKLKYYNLLNNTEIDMNRMINKIWK